MKKKIFKCATAMVLSATMLIGSASTAMADGYNSYLKNVDNIQNTRYQSSEIRPVTFPSDQVSGGENLYWQNWHGGTDYILVYGGPRGDYKAAGYEDKWYPNAQIYPTYETWTTPSGITIDYLGRVLDENGKIKTSTAEQIGADYEGGKIRDVAYDSNYPLKRVVDFYALNVEQITPANFNSAELNHHGLRKHNQSLVGDVYFISKLSGQPNNIHDDSWYTEEEKTEYNAVVDVLRNWLNSFDFEHMSEMDRAKKIHELVKQATYNTAALTDKSLNDGHAYYNILVKKTGTCYDYSMTIHLLASLVGLKCDTVGSATNNHMIAVLQVDGVPYGSDNGLIALTQDWREETNLGTKQSFNYHFGEYITYY